MKNLQRILVILVLGLMVLGALLVFSASGTYSEIKFNDIYSLFKSHIWKIIAALASMIIFSIIPYEYYKKFSKPLLLGIIIILILTVIISPKLKGASRWIDLGLVTFQPSELAKLILFMHLAGMIERKGKLIQNFKNGFQYPLIWVIIVGGLVLIQPNFSTSIIIMLTSFTVLYVGGARLKHIVTTLGVISIFGGTVMMLFSHSRERMIGFIESIRGAGEANIQVMQAKIGLGSGGIWGVGLGQSRQSDLFLPESYGDFIFSILGEEFGLLGTVTVLAIYFAIFFIGVIIAKNSKDTFGQLLGFGISFNIIISAFINSAVVTGLIPTTGITLPFISFGGTSIILFSASIGILINITMQSAKEKDLRIEPID